MAMLLSSARAAAIAGLAIASAILGLWVAASTIDLIGLASFLVRFVHVLAGIVWVGMIWFVNFVQLAAVEAADENGRATIMRLVAPRVAQSFRYASHLSLASGFVLLVTTGYLFDRWVFSSAVYVPPLKLALLWGGTAAAVVMWAFVHLIIWPSLQLLVTDKMVPPEAKSRARARIRTYARLNLVLAIPVTFVMVGAAHLY